MGIHPWRHRCTHAHTPAHVRRGEMNVTVINKAQKHFGGTLTPGNKMWNVNQYL